jgi:hypothetical protein
LIVAAAQGGGITYGVSASKGCNSPTAVGQPDVCFYVFSNTGATSGDTVILTAANDVVRNDPSDLTDGGTTYNGTHADNLLHALQLVFAAGPSGPPVCTGGAGAGTVASPYVGATSCTLPFGAAVASNPAGWYTVQAADANLPNHQLNDQVEFTWMDLCDVHADPGSCNPLDSNIAQAPSSTHILAVSALTTSAAPQGGTVGDMLTDVAHLTGVSNDAGGTITFHLYKAVDNTKCPPGPDEVGSPVTKTVSGPGDYTSPAIRSTSAIGYVWVATYSGDANNLPVGPTSCLDRSEFVTLAKRHPQLVTKASQPGAPSPTTTITDTATLSLGTDDISGTITFHVFADPTCKSGELFPDPSNHPNAPGTATVHGNGDYVSPPVTVTTPGSYYWQAEYGGDGNNVAVSLTTCADLQEISFVPEPQPVLVTAATSTTNAPGTVTDTATLSKTILNAGGTITFHLYSDPSCVTEVPGSPMTKTVSGDGSYTSPPITLAKTGPYFWRDSYSGDANNLPVLPTPCGAPGETSTVGPTGQLEICKAPDNNAAGQPFRFSAVNLAGGAPVTITVVGGTCAPAFDAAVGKWQITEDLTIGLWKMAGAVVVPSTQLVLENDALGWVKVRVSKNQETQVTVIDKQAGATLKVCKYSSAPAFQGSEYSFTVGTSVVTATAGATRTTAGCSFPVSVQPGSLIKITEALPAGDKVAGVTVSSNATISSTNLKLGVAKVTVGAGANIVYYDNEPVSPP